MGPVTEVASFSLNSADDGQALSQVLNDILLQQPGCSRVRWGLTHEDATKARAFIDWEDISGHEQFKASSSYQPFVEKMSPFIESKPQLHHVQFEPTPSPVLDNEQGKSKSSVIEVLYLHFPSDDSFTTEMKDKATSNAERFLAESAPNAKGCTGRTATGWTIENVEFKGEPCRALAILIGWESLEAHQQYRQTEAFGKSLSLLRDSPGMKPPTVLHVTFSTVERST